MRWTPLQIRSRQRWVAALLIALVAVFSAGAILHHLADHADGAAAATQHGDGGDHDAICAAGAAACGIAMLLMGLIGLGFVRIPPPVAPRRRRWRFARGGLSPGSLLSRPLRRAELQSFLT